MDVASHASMHGTLVSSEHRQLNKNTAQNRMNLNSKLKIDLIRFS